MILLLSMSCIKKVNTFFFRHIIQLIVLTAVKQYNKPIYPLLLAIVEKLYHKLKHGSLLRLEIIEESLLPLCY